MSEYFYERHHTPFIGEVYFTSLNLLNLWLFIMILVIIIIVIIMLFSCPCWDWWAALQHASFRACQGEWWGICEILPFLKISVISSYIILVIVIQCDQVFLIEKLFHRQLQSNTSARGGYKQRYILSLELLQVEVLFKIFNVKNLMWHFCSQILYNKYQK